MHSGRGSLVTLKGINLMKRYLLVSIVVVLSCCSVLPAQSVGGTAPVVQSEYVTSSSPLSDGRAVTSYYSPQASTPTSRIVYSQETGSRIVYQPTSTSATPAGVTSTTVTSAAAAPASDPYYRTTSVQAIAQPAYASGCCQPIGGNQPTVTYYPSSSAGCADSVYPGAYGGTYGGGYSGHYAYSPVSSNQQLPPGAYFGKGSIGQPKVYMDGQPLRNSLRFIFP